MATGSVATRSESFTDPDNVPETGCLSIIVLGASGDLAKKKTFPALFNLYRQVYLFACLIYSLVCVYFIQDPFDCMENEFLRKKQHSGNCISKSLFPMCNWPYVLSGFRNNNTVNTIEYVLVDGWFHL